MKKQSRIFDWEFIRHDSWVQLVGTSWGDPRFPDGERIKTSMVERVDFVAGFAETKNTIYSLEWGHGC